jgi:nucleoside-diphosphate-sugar epimerase
VSTAAVYDRSPGRGDVSDDSPLVDDDGGAYAVTKRDTDLALAQVDGITRVLVRPPSILGPGETSVWNTLQPAAVRDGDRSVNPDKSFAWVHLDDLAALLADVATGAIPTADDPDLGPVAGGTTAVVVSGEHATWRDYLGAVTSALGVDPEWTDEPVWTGRLVADRALRWGWSPSVGLQGALDELRAGLARRH